MPDGIKSMPMRGPYRADQTQWNDVAVQEHLCRLAQVAEATASSVVITDAKGVIVWVNEGFIKLSGYSYEEVIGQIPGHLLQGPDTDSAVVTRIGNAIRAKTAVAAELINYNKAGRRFWIGMKIQPLFDANGEVDGFMAIEAEITERHERSRALEQLTARFDMATQAGHIGMYEFDATFKEVWWNKVMWEIFAQDPLVFCPTPRNWQSLVHVDDRERVRAHAGRRGHERTELMMRYRIVRPDGSIRHVQSIASIADGQGLTGALLDVTDRVAAEERESQLQQQLRETSHRAGMAEIATGVLHKTAKWESGAG